ncbi:sigma-70 family RNA polymerase sigma factor [Dyella silvatica]|uniref:sigma-70 family RNA polymerase sigma factor n=1 Tax=Dyella silvatica TaxID=2992128 RepID=UPI002251D39C|nr:sigma-70 family RNA polymerase sigma factor [Dyella silvatica]
MNVIACDEHPDVDEITLWTRWRVDGDRIAYEALVLCYTPWVRQIARDVFMRVRGHSKDWPDFVQNASVGLLEAMASFQLSRHVPFRAYARLRVRGAVFNGLRALYTQQGMHTDEQAWRERVDSLLDAPEEDPVEQLIAVVSGLGAVHMLSAYADQEAFQTPHSPYDEAVHSQLSDRLSKLLAMLPERERLVLQLHYLQHMAFVQIADALDLTKGRISQLHKQGLGKLRSRMIQESWHQAL